MKSNMNIQFVTGHYGVLKYLTSYMCKPERTTSELMKKAAKECTNKGVQDKLYAIGNVFLTKREVSTDDAIVRTLSLPMRSSKIDTVFIVTGLKENRTRALKSRTVLENMHPDDENVYAPNILDKYMNRPDRPEKMKNMCLADFATSYIHHSAYEPEIETDDIRSYTTAVSTIDLEDDESSTKAEIITLKDELGKMRKRKRPCVMRYHKASKLKDPELYYLTLLQLYMPWQKEVELKGDFESYEDKYNHIESDIKQNILNHDPYIDSYDVDVDELIDNVSSYSSDDEDTPRRNQFNFLNPEMLDFETSDSTNSTNIPVSSSTIENRSMSRDKMYEMCSQLNKEQLEIFHYVMRHAVEIMLNERNDLPEPEPIYSFLSGGAGVGKSFVTLPMVENLQNVLKFHLQDFATQPSVVVTASTGIAATHLNGTTLHTAFLLPLNDNRPIIGNSAINNLQKKYKHLKILITDEVSMTGIDTWDALNLTLQKIKNNKRDFGGVSVITVGDLLQLPPVKMGTFFSLIRARLNDPWLRLFKLHELTQIMRQCDDPEFADILSRVREGKHTKHDIEAIKQLEYTDTSSWPGEITHLYITNHLTDAHNDACLSKLENTGKPIATVISKDKGRISHNLSIGKTGNLRHVLKVGEGSKVMVTKNIDVDDRLVNGTLGTVNKLDRVGNDPYGYPLGRIYIQCDDPKAGNKLKDARLRSEFRELVPIEPVVQPFKYNGTMVERNQFPVTLAHAMTTHKSQGNTLVYFIGDVDQTPAPGKQRRAPCGPGMFYTMLSRGKTRKNIKLQNFHENCIVVNKEALKEMERMRKESVLMCSHPLEKLDQPNICLYNIRRWKKHIQHFVNDKAFSMYSSVFCFTETHLQDQQDEIKNYLPGWKDIHYPIGVGLSICYNKEKVKMIKEFDYIGALQILPALMEINDQLILLVLVYRPDGPMAEFVRNLIECITSIESQIDVERPHRLLIVGDFNWDQMLPEHVTTFDRIRTSFNCSQRSNYSTHILGGILDLVFDNGKSSDVNWMFSPYSDHFIILIDL